MLACGVLRCNISISRVPQMSSRKVEPALDRALDYLSGRQLSSGEFSSYIMPDGQTPADSLYDSSPFMTSLVVYALGFVNDLRAGTMIEKALDFMSGESEGPGVWRFWTRRHPQHFF